MGYYSGIIKGYRYSFYLVNAATSVDLAIGVINGDNLDPSDFGYCVTTEGVKYFLRTLPRFYGRDMIPNGLIN